MKVLTTNEIKQLNKAEQREYSAYLRKLSTTRTNIPVNSLIKIFKKVTNHV